MKKAAILLLIAAAFAGGFGYGRWFAKPIPAKAAGTPARKILYWVDPMHPTYKSDKPGIAPDCGMKLVPMYGDDDAAGGGMADAAPGTITVSTEKQQLIGVTYGTAEYASLTDTIHANARVTLDETHIAKVQPKIQGWIDKVYVDFVGKEVRAGEPMLTIYSPDALSTQQEYLLALKAQKSMHDNPVHEMRESTDDLVAAAKKRLELWDFSGPQIDEIGRTGETVKNLRLDAPASGFVMERNAYTQQHVTPDTVLYTIAGLSDVWVIADVFEYEAAGVRLDQPATLTVPYLPGRVFHGRVSYILPEVDPTSRTLKVRLQFENPGFQLKPDMYGEVDLLIGGARKLVVPEGAVLNSGDRQVVFLDRGEGRFEPRNVTIGQQSDGKIEILSGLQAGDRIVTSGNFLLDSESQLKAGGK